MLPFSGITRRTVLRSICLLTIKWIVPSHPKGHFQRGHSQKKKSPRLIYGRLSVHRDGYGFVTPEEPVPGLKGDVYLGKEDADRAMHGDRVAIRIKRLERDGRAHGEIMEVVKRAHTSIVGEFRVRKRGNFVVPHDDRIRQWIEIPEGMAIPAGGVSVDRVGARAVEVHSEEDLDGLIVTADYQLLDNPAYNAARGPIRRIAAPSRVPPRVPRPRARGLRETSA